MIKNKKNAFTIIELLVAMALLVMMLSLSGLIFNTTVNTYRAAGATVDITRSLGVITSQLSTDFGGLRVDAPLTIWFEQQWSVDKDGDTQQDPDEYLYYDQIQFFADGDFQTTKQYAGQIISGNTARVYYGHAWLLQSSSGMPNAPHKTYRQFKVADGDAVDSEAACLLARRAHIQTNYDVGPAFPAISSGVLDPASFLPLNNLYECDKSCTITSWNQLFLLQANCDTYLNCFNSNYDPVNIVSITGRPVIDLGMYQRLHMLLSQGVVQMRIQWAYAPADLNGYVTGFTQGVRWWPSPDPNGDGDIADSDFTSMNLPQFGVHFNLVAGTSLSNWFSIQNCGTGGTTFKNTFYPKALKFTLTLKDSNGLFDSGKTFTHIVYLEN